MVLAGVASCNVTELQQYYENIIELEFQGPTGPSTLAPAGSFLVFEKFWFVFPYFAKVFPVVPIVLALVAEVLHVVIMVLALVTKVFPLVTKVLTLIIKIYSPLLIPLLWNDNQQTYSFVKC